MERKNELPSGKEGNEQSLSASSVVSFAESHQNVILAVLGGIVALVALYFVLNQYVWGPRDNAAKNEIFKAQQMFARDSFQVALDGKEDEFMGFLDIIDEYGSTSTGNLACAYAGICYKNLGEYDEAIKFLNKFSGSDELVSPSIVGAVGDCYWDLENASKAVDYYLKAASMADNDLLSPLYKKRAALAYLSMDKKSEAAKLLEGIITDYPNYADMNDVMKFLEIAKQN
ncbi:MAG: tetratricopeptide repeat protein [Paludibacteraceae bacterium]|nr:tetratricopeptide repeat protein [Paludibacteraceae bacterium]MBR4713409.1 tetratricopeptide repeat protein [Paludibacteraceae bacterium]MBR5375342.1 tetratricopeptide repeat protein [Paludibacteraceae bacterium]